MARGRTTIADVARAAGVSKGLVSFALNDRPGVSSTTRDRILAIARDLGWTPSLRARALSTRRAFALGLVIARDPGILAADPFFPAMIAGIETSLGPAGQTLVLSMVPDEAAEMASYRRLAADDRVDGVILTDLRVADPRIALMSSLGLAAVTLGRPEGPSPYPAITLDDTAGIRQSVLHLAQLGHQRIAHVGGPEHMLHGRRRRETFVLALHECGLAGDLTVETDFSAASGAAATRHLLSLPHRPTAIVYANDPMAIAGMGVAQRVGMRVPDDLSVTGFDGSDAGEYSNPPLTSVTTHAHEWGRVAAETLMLATTGGDARDVDLCPAALLVRESTGAAPGRHAIESHSQT